MLIVTLVGVLPIVCGRLLIAPNWDNLTSGLQSQRSSQAFQEHRCSSPVLLFDGLWSLCRSNRPYVQLGLCSSHFIECSHTRGGAVVRTCPYKSLVFMNGRCFPAENFPECKDRTLNQINEETKQLVEADSFCANGAGIYRSQCSDNHCSRQALVCHPNKRDAIPLICPAGYVLTQTLECVPAPRRCTPELMLATPIRQLFLHRACEAASTYNSKTAQKGKTHCASWYVMCQPQPYVVYCAPGEVFDSHQKRCRKWTSSDACVMAGICRKHEWESVPLGKCESHYIFCEGSVGKLYTCGESMVFNGTYCSPRNTIRGCAVCSPGQMRPGSSCDEYYECMQSSHGPQWVLQKCDRGSAFNARQMICQPDYACATKGACVQGSSFPVNCRDYMYCTGEHYEIFSCPPNTRWNALRKLCVEDLTCNRRSFGPSRQCLEGYTIPSSDCVSYQICYNGKYITANCGNVSETTPGPCTHCFTPPNKYGVDQLTFPGQCSSQDRLPHKHDCTAFYVCDNANWVYKRCESPGQIFDVLSKKCREGNPWNCAPYAEVQCQHGERIVDKNSPLCDRRVAECRYGKWVHLRCPEGYVFDEITLDCIRGVCHDQQQKSEQSYLNQAAPPAPPPVENRMQAVPAFVAPSCQGNMKIADQYDCARFWQCGRAGRFESMVCPAGSVFEAIAQDCVKGKCSSTICGEGSFQPSENCGHYKTCYNGQWIEARCNHGKQFVNGHCTNEDCVKQNYRESHYARLQCRTGAVRPHPSNKRSYMFCQYGMWMERSCSGEATFDWKALGCVLSHNQPSSYKPKCYEGATRDSSDTSSCSLYEQCVRGKWVKKTCAFNQRYYNGQCVDGLCTERSCRGSSGVDGYRRVESDCSKYYQCVHGSWVERPCAPGTVFNERLSVCDHARNVPECGG